MPLILRENIGRRLTIEEMDGNFLYLQSNISGGMETISATAAVILQNNSQIITGAIYQITGCDTNLFGAGSQFNFGYGTTIVLNGLSSSSFSKNGYGLFYTPNYASYSVWDYTGATTYLSGTSSVIYGGRVWENITGTFGYSTDNLFTLDGTNWSVISYTNSTFYNAKWDEIEYDIQFDHIASRYDGYLNNSVRINELSDSWFFCSVNPIQVFRWGHRLEDGGVDDCDVINSYFNCLNYMNGYIHGVEMTNYSSICFASGGVDLQNGGYIESLKLDNQSYISTVYINGVGGSSYIKNMSMNNASFLQGVSLYNSYLNYITLDNYSYLENITMYTSYMSYIKMDTDSFFYNMGVSFSNIQYLNLNNNSYIQNTTLSSSCEIQYMELTDCSYIVNSALVNSYMGYVELYNESYVENFYLTNAEIYDSQIYNYSGIYYVYLVDSEIYNMNFNYNSYLDEVYLTNSQMYNIEMSDSYIENLYLYLNSYAYDIKMVSSWIYNTTLFSADNSCSIYNLSLENSVFQNISMTNSSANTYIGYLTLKNNSFFGANTFGNFVIGDGTYISYVNLDNGSYINDNVGNINLYTNSYMKYVSLDNNSYISNIGLSNSSYLKYMKLENNSEIDSVFINDSYVSYIDMTNQSVITGEANSIYLLNSFLNSIKMDSSFISDINLYSTIAPCALEQINLNNSSMYNIYMNSTTENNLYISYVYMENNCYIRGITFTSSNNTVYMTEISLKNNSIIDGGSSGYGQYISLGQGCFMNQISLDNGSYISIDDDAISLFDNSFFQNITLNNDSFITGYMELHDYSYFNNISMDNNSAIDGSGGNGDMYFYTGSYLSNIVLKNYSRVVGGLIFYSGSYINYLNMNNNSLMGNGIYLSSDGSDASNFYNIEITNNSAIGGVANIYLYNTSNIQNIKLDNNSNLYGYIELHDGSQINNVELLNSSNIIGGNSDYLGIYLYNASSLNLIDISNNSYIEGYLVMTGSYASNLINVNLTNNSYMSGGTYSGFGIYLFDNVTFSSIYMNNNSSIKGNLTAVSSILQNFNITNHSTIGGSSQTSNYYGNFYNFIIYGKIIDLTISDYSLFNYFDIEGTASSISTITAMELTYANLLYTTLINNSYINSLNILDSEVNGLVLIDDSYIEWMQMINVSIGYDTPAFYGASSSSFANIYFNNVGGQGMQVMNNSYMNAINLYTTAYDYLVAATYSYFNKITVNNSINSYNVNRTNATIALVLLSNNSFIDTMNCNNSNFGDNNSLSYTETVTYITLDGTSSIFNMDMDEGGFYDVHLTNNSYINDMSIKSSDLIYTIYLDDSSYMSFVSINNNSYFYGIYLATQSYINYTDIDNSYVYSNNLQNNSYWSNITMNNNSYLYENVIINNSYINNMTMNNNSYIYALNFTNNSYFDYMTLNNNSYFGSIGLSGSYIYAANSDGGGFYSNYLNSGNIIFLYMRDAEMTGINSTTDGFYTQHLDLSAVALNFGGAYSGIASLPSYTIFNTNTLKYQFNISFNGSVGYGSIGTVSVTPMLVPNYGNGFYIEKVVLDCTGLSYSGDTEPILNIGMLGVDNRSGLNNSYGGVTNINNKVSVFDISNGRVNGIKTYGQPDNTLISMYIANNSITSGSIDAEIILKSTNYGYIND